MYPRTSSLPLESELDRDRDDRMWVQYLPDIYLFVDHRDEYRENENGGKWRRQIIDDLVDVDEDLSALHFLDDGDPGDGQAHHNQDE